MSANASVEQSESARFVGFWSRYGDALFYALLTVLVWGLTAPLRGLWQDDTIYLSMMVRRRGHFLKSLFGPIGSPLRRLYGLPSWLAYRTPRPILTLQLLHGAFWVGHALCAGWIVGMLMPKRPLIRFAAIALTLTATSDYMTSNLTAMGYNFAILTLLLAIGSGLRFVKEGGTRWLVASASLLTISVWTVDIAFTAMPFVPLLLFLLPRLRTEESPLLRRGLILLAVCGAVTLPAAILEWRFLHDPHDYAAIAILPLPRRELAERIVSMWLENFEPWRWVFSRPLFGPRPPVLMPMTVMATLSLVAAVACFLRARAQSVGENLGRDWKRPLLLVAVFCAMALLCNGLYARLQFADLHYRTHVLSRVWASLALAIVTGWAAARWPRARSPILVALALFVGLGAWGGLERQDLFLSVWRQHQRELLSIVENVPAYRDGTGVILRSDATSYYMATEADYLARDWFNLLYDRPSIHSLRLSPKRGTECRSSPRGLDCWHENGAATGRPPTDHFDYATLIVLDFDERTGRYSLVRSLTGDPLAANASGAERAYQPERLIVRGPITPFQRHLLLLD